MPGMSWMVRGAVVGALMVSGTAALCQESATEQAALARALRARHVALATGIEAAAATGTPISAKYEYEDGKLQLSVYTEKAGQFFEVVVDRHTGKIATTETITDADDLKASQAQSAATAKATVSLAAALANALAANPAYRAVSATAMLEDGKPVAEITLIEGTEFKTVTASLAPQQQSASSWTSVEDALGRTGAMQPGTVIKFSFPRSDLSVNVGGVTLKPAFALGGWVAFKEIGHGHAMAMGDLVLTEDEVSSVMRALQAAGVEQTALHNHVLMESPRVMYMHISARGDAAKIARAIHDALGQTKTPLGPPSAPAVPSAADLDTAGIARALGMAGKLNGVVYQVSVPRRETITEMGVEVPPSMGVATAINFQPTGRGKAAITGDFVLRGSEVNPVIRALTSHGIAVTAVHSHMLDEEPRLFFMHFWAVDDAVTLAQGLRAALDATASKR